MDFVHRKCGGYISPSKRTCTRCGKKWSRTSIYTDTQNIRLSPGTNPANVVASKVIGTGDTSYAKWGDKVPVAWWVASRLPNWPRWARILSVVVVYGGGLAALIFLFKWAC